MKHRDLNAVIIENLNDIELAMDQLDDLTKDIFSTVDQLVKKWSIENGWVGEFAYLQKGLWLAPRDWWDEKNKEKQIARFWLELEGGDTGDTSWSYLSNLCGVLDPAMGYRLEQAVLSKSGAWKKILAQSFTDVDSDLFILDSDGQLFIRVAVPLAELVTSVREGAPEDALRPFLTTLDQVATSTVSIRQILEKARLSLTAQK